MPLDVGSWSTHILVIDPARTCETEHARVDTPPWSDLVQVNVEAVVDLQQFSHFTDRPTIVDRHREERTHRHVFRSELARDDHLSESLCEVLVTSVNSKSVQSREAP